MKAKPYLFAAALLLGLASAANGTPFISSFWLSAYAQTANDVPHYYTNRSGSVSVSPGALVYFMVTAGGTPPICYQWRTNGIDIPGATCCGVTTCKYGYPGVELPPAAYSVVVTDGSGQSITSQVATLTVDTTFTKIVSDPVVNTADFALGGTWAPFWECDTNLDANGYPDLFVYNGLNKSSAATVSSMYHNNHDGTFTQQAPYSIPPIGNPAIATSASVGDIDNDGYPDLFVTSFHLSYLYHNDGGGNFTQIITGPPVEDVANNNITGSVWADFDQDGFLDLLVTRYDPTLGSYCWLYRNNGDGTFTRITDSALVQDIGSSLGCVLFDYDGDGRMDVFITGGGGSAAPAQLNRLFRGNPDGTFTRMTNASIGSIVTNRSYSGIIACGDYNGDGFPDLLIVNLNYAGGTNFLYRNNGNGTFTQVTGRIVANTTSGWFVTPNTPTACVWGDINNDGFLDLFIADHGDGSQPFVNYIYLNNGDGTFTQYLEGSPVNEYSGSYGCSLVDINNDGFLDLFASRFQGNGHALYQNNGNSNAWLKVKLIGTVSNRSAIGAKVRVKASYRGASRWQLRQISGGSGWLSNPELLAHFGLGDATNADTVRIEWPSGAVQEFHNVAPRQMLTITEPPHLLASVTNGAPRCLLKGGRGMQYDIQTSTDLKTWSPMGSVTVADISGLVQINDTNAPMASRRFYRAVSH